MPESNTGVVDGLDDLGPVLRDIGTGMMARTRAKLANSPETRAFLEIGLDLLREDLIQHTGPDFDHGTPSRLFDSLSRERVLARPEAQELLLSVNMFRHRWERKDRYSEDLISYVFRLTPQLRRMDGVRAATTAMIGQVSLGELVRLLARAELEALRSDPLVCVQAILQSALPNHTRVREFCKAHLDELLPRWADLYRDVATAHGLALRPGRTWLDVALLFNTAIVGELHWTRVSARPTLANGESVLTGALLAMMPSLVDGLSDDVDQQFAR